MKVALVTGSTSGIGKAIAIKLAENGHQIIINGASTTELSHAYKEKLLKSYGRNK